MLSEFIPEARRQIQICNACRYCEGYCSVFPAIHRQRSFSDGDIVQFANLCHNCRGCYYACQYIAPHEFAINLPKALADVQRESWKEYAWPSGLATLFDKAGVVFSAMLALACTLLFLLTNAIRPESGEGFYAYMSHGIMVMIFAPSFLLPLCSLGISLRRYWSDVEGGSITWNSIWVTIGSTARMKDLSGGHGEGCNFEVEERYSNLRRWLHQATLYGFLLCFASTSAGTVLHYGFSMEAPYDLLSLPKLLGVTGGLLLCAGTAGLAWTKLKADRQLGAASAWGGEMAFVLLLFAVSATGLVLYAAAGTSAVALLLPLHLGCVLTLFLLTPYSKMAHGFYRAAALLRNASHQTKARRVESRMQ